MQGWKRGLSFKNVHNKALSDILELASRATTMDLQKCGLEASMVSHTNDPSTWKVEAEGLQLFQREIISYPGLHSYIGA